MPVEVFAKFDSKLRRLTCRNEWNLSSLVRIKKELKNLRLPVSGQISVDGSAITKMDSAGAWLITKTIETWSKHKLDIRTENFSEQAQKLLELVQKRMLPGREIPKLTLPNIYARIGRSFLAQINGSVQFLNFTGLLTVEFLRNLLRPTHWRWHALSGAIETTGFRALPIVALLSFMIGVVIAYQMGNQLRTYGANVFIVNLLGLSVLREFGPLITAIMVAGRTGSAFTAQLGIMKINQEIDALDTMGVTTAELLLLPRLIGLLITLPLLTIWADIFGVLGGMLMANNMLGISYYDFMHRFQHEIPVRSLLIGLGKAPIFALLIGSIGCFQGMQVTGSAESVGKLTTRSVVQAIFFIIVADAIFSVVFSRLGL